MQYMRGTNSKGKQSKGKEGETFLDDSGFKILTPQDIFMKES